MTCEYCNYFYRASKYDEETEETIWLEKYASCHFDGDEILGPAPCEEEDDAWDRWEVESSRDDWDYDEEDF